MNPPFFERSVESYDHSIVSLYIFTCFLVKSAPYFANYVYSPELPSKYVLLSGFTNYLITGLERSLLTWRSRAWNFYDMFWSLQMFNAFQILTVLLKQIILIAPGPFKIPANHRALCVQGITESGVLFKRCQRIYSIVERDLCGIMWPRVQSIWNNFDARKY